MDCSNLSTVLLAMLPSEHTFAHVFSLFRLRCSQSTLCVACNTPIKPQETEDLDLDVPTLQQGVSAVLEGKSPAAYYVVEDEGGSVAGSLML